jgi:hypothetical protein
VQHEALTITEPDLVSTGGFDVRLGHVEAVRLVNPAKAISLQTTASTVKAVSQPNQELGPSVAASDVDSAPSRATGGAAT